MPACLPVVTGPLYDAFLCISLVERTGPDRRASRHSLLFQANKAYFHSSRITHKIRDDSCLNPSCKEENLYSSTLASKVYNLQKFTKIFVTGSK